MRAVFLWIVSDMNYKEESPSGLNRFWRGVDDPQNLSFSFLFFKFPQLLQIFLNICSPGALRTTSFNLGVLLAVKYVDRCTRGPTHGFIKSQPKTLLSTFDETAWFPSSLLSEKEFNFFFSYWALYVTSVHSNLSHMERWIHRGMPHGNLPKTGSLMGVFQFSHIVNKIMAFK